MSWCYAAGMSRSVRDRTVSKMRVLLSSAALSASACSATDPGYGVVDPMPPPARCSGPAQALTGTARFERAPDGTSDLIVRMDPPKEPGVAYELPNDAMTPSATIKQRLDQGGLEIRVTNPLVDALSLNIPIRLACSEGPANAHIEVRWTADERQTGATLGALSVVPEPGY